MDRSGVAPDECMSPVAVKATLRQLIAEVAHVKPEDIHDYSTLEDDIPLPSVVFIELQAAVEDMFDIELDPVEVVERNTFSAIAELVSEKIAARPC
jgi:acyl carrier protein